MVIGTILAVVVFSNGEDALGKKVDTAIGMLKFFSRRRNRKNVKR